MTVDEVIRQAFLDKGLTLEEINELDRKGDAIDPVAATFGKIEVSEEQAAMIRSDLEILTQLPKDTVIAMLNSYQQRVRRHSIVN